MITFQNLTIVIPYDFSAPSRHAVNQVFEWADESNAIHLVYVVVPTPTVVDINPPVWLPPNLDNDTRDLMAERLRELYGDRKNLSIHCIVGDPGAEIVELSKQEKADLIVMPSHGRSGLTRLVLGSVAERVLRLSECPVYVLRGEKFEKDDPAAAGASENR